MKFENIERRLVEALIVLLLNARGKVVSIKATSLAKMAGLGSNHGAILKAARLLRKLSMYKFLKIEPSSKSSKTYRYILKTDDELWQIVKKDPERAKEIILKLLS